MSQQLDRRWIFLAMLLAVAIPLLCQLTFPEFPSDKTRDVFNLIDRLPEGSHVLLSFDYEPSSEAELSPMAAGFVRQCCEKHLKLYFMTLWERGAPILKTNVDIIEAEYPEMKYGVDYVNLGFKPGNEGVIKNAVSSLAADFLTDHHGTSLARIPLTRNIENLQDMQLIVTVGSGSPGPKEWIQFASAPYGIPTVAGATGVEAPHLYPYLPNQLQGLLAAIKSAAEYEQMLIDHYPKLAEVPRAREGLRRMGPQLAAHILMVGLILLGNILYFRQRRRGTVR